MFAFDGSRRYETLHEIWLFNVEVQCRILAPSNMCGFRYAYKHWIHGISSSYWGSLTLTAPSRMKAKGPQ